MSTTVLGLDSEKVIDLNLNLNKLLANFQVYYQSLRGLHWNIKGKSFFELHLKFEELYTDANIKVDLIAERILTLGQTPLHTFDDYNAVATVPVGENISKDDKAVRLIVESLTELLKLERLILDAAGDANDEGSNSMMSDFITEQEKTVWMMKAWLNETI